METNRKKYCFTLDLKDDPKAIETYKEYHKNIWPEIRRQIKSTGVEVLEIYLVSNRLFMIMETTPQFSLIEKQKKRCRRPKSSRMGIVDVKVSASASLCSAR